MNKKEFLERLEQLLGVLPEEEREEALQYYMDYLEDAGEENEERVMADLGSPEEVAARIRAGFSGADSEYSETGYEDVRFENHKNGLQKLNESDSAAHDGIYDSVEDAARAGGKPTNIWKVICIILICFIAAPVILPLGFGILVAIGALILALLALIFGIGVAGITVIGAGILVVAAGVVRAFVTPAAGILAAGLGCLVLAIGILVTWVIILCAIRIVPWLIRGIVGILRYPFRKAGAIS